ncbi:hypothetical protein BTZ20_0526 [Rhodococcus sp. MTM3W5.2]|nr:hypothetical protein BTZ20_0526 [Rhodococcus sp. MTM3W5.2]
MAAARAGWCPPIGGPRRSVTVIRWVGAKASARGGRDVHPSRPRKGV